jgi:DNA-binding CsgD family transcriptional regulator/tetratricopeptide (TPR) repeat protein
MPHQTERMPVEQVVVCPILVGRDAPLSAGFHALDRAHAAHGGALLVSGEAGIGKSRVTRAMLERARTLGFLALQGACFEADRAQPYAPILDLVRALAATTSRALVEHYFAPASVELVTLFPELRSTFPDTTARHALDPEDDRRRFFHSFTEAILTLGKVQPVLLVIEDVHWSDDATLDLMLHLARRISADPIAIILTFRSDEVGTRLSRLLADFDRARCASELSLNPLAAHDVSTMLQSIFGPQVSFGSAFVNSLHGLTEGNPFFIEEMLKSMVVAGDLTRTDGAWRARPLDNVHVPRTATEAVGRRLAGLSEDARKVASIAAVAGRRFDFGLLQALTTHGELELLSLVKELVDAQLVIEESADRFAFRHALTREAIRARLLVRERVALHRAIATALEQDHARRPQDESDEALAYHTFEAGAWEPARRYALRAAERALTLSAPREALQHFERAVTATENAGLQADASLFIGRGQAHETLGAFGLANDDFSAALTAARESGDRRSEWKALHALGMLWAARDYDRAGQYRLDALEVARAIGDPSLIARSLNRVGNWYVNREDPHSGVPHHDEALAIFEQAADARGVAETVDLLAMAHHIAGAQDTAVPLYERAVDVFTTLEDRRGLANALAVLSVCGPSHHASAGPVGTSDHAAALLTDERTIRLAADIGWRAGEAFSRFVLADCLAWRAEYRRALNLARESLAISQEIEHLQWECGARRVLGVIALDLFDSVEAITQLRAAHDIARRLGSATWIRWTGAPLAIALARSGQPDQAAAIVDAVDRTVPRSIQGDELRRTVGERFIDVARGEIALAAGNPAEVIELVGDSEMQGTPRAALLRAEALVLLERWNEAAGALDVARREAQRQGARSLLWRIDALSGTVHLGQRHRLEARRWFDVARETAAKIAMELEEPALVASFRAGVDHAAPPPPARTAGQVARDAHGGLTRRERDTAALVAQGKSNRAIARQLGIGERTVEGYVASILGKLGFASRAQIAVWADKQLKQ